MSDDILERARIAVAGITPGQWQASGVRIRMDGQPYLQIVERAFGGVAYVPYSDRRPGEHVASHTDARFIAAAPDLVRDLIAEVERLREGRTA